MTCTKYKYILMNLTNLLSTTFYSHSNYSQNELSTRVRNEKEYVREKNRMNFKFRTARLSFEFAPGTESTRFLSEISLIHTWKTLVAFTQNFFREYYPQYIKDDKRLRIYGDRAHYTPKARIFHRLFQVFRSISPAEKSTRSTSRKTPTAYRSYVYMYMGISCANRCQ